jgi:hypothetical protein
MENNEGFHFTYSAAQQQEVENIRKKYIYNEEDKMEQLRRLHRSASQKAKSFAITLGVIGALIMGAGMSLTMTDLGESLGFDSNLAMLIGIAIGVAGMILVALAYPVYNRVLKKERARIAPEILRLTDDLLK